VEGTLVAIPVDCFVLASVKHMNAYCKVRVLVMRCYIELGLKVESSSCAT